MGDAFPCCPLSAHYSPRSGWPMQEIVTVETVGAIFNLLAALFPLIGAMVGAGYQLRSRDRGSAWRMGLGVGVIGPANWLLWRLYNALTDRNGLDTVRNFAVNLVVFVVIGLGIGIVIGVIQHRGMTVARAETNEPDVETLAR